MVTEYPTAHQKRKVTEKSDHTSLVSVITVIELTKRYQDSVIVLMIEKKGAVENLESILAVKGVDMVQFGPSDYGMSIGLGGQRDHPTVVEAREHVIKTALKMGVRPRAEISGPAEAEYYLNLGVKDFNLSTDTAILAGFYRDQGAKLREVVNHA